MYNFQKTLSFLNFRAPCACKGLRAFAFYLQLLSNVQIIHKGKNDGKTTRNSSQGNPINGGDYRAANGYDKVYIFWLTFYTSLFGEKKR